MIACGAPAPSPLSMGAMSAIADLGARAKAASRVLATASTEAKDAALGLGADLLVEHTDDLLAANARDVEAAADLDVETLRRAKRHGFSDKQIGEIRGLDEAVVRELRHALHLRPVYKTVDTCAAEFAAKTPYHYSSYDEETEVAPREKPAVLILGSGPNRIGQGVEFDYSCVHASFALRDAGFETVMVNCNPETVSTDYDTSDRL